jgi:hypothetical protein
MKSVVWLTTATLGLVAVATAGSITCTPFGATFPNGGGTAGLTTTITCAGFAPDPGFNLSTVTLNYVADYEFGDSTPVDVRFFFTPTPMGGVVYTPNTATIDVTGNFSSLPATSASAIAGSFTNSSFLSGLTVNVMSKVVAGAVEDSAAGVTITYTETSQTPEPASLGILGACLIGLGLVKRKTSK